MGPENLPVMIATPIGTGLLDPAYEKFIVQGGKKSIIQGTQYGGTLLKHAIG